MYAGLWPAVVKGKEPPAVKPEALHDLPVGSIVGVVGRGVREFLHRTTAGWSPAAVQPAARRHGPSRGVTPEQVVTALRRVDGTVYLLYLGKDTEADLRAWKTATEGPGTLMPQPKKRGAPLPDMPAWTAMDIVKRLGWVGGDNERLAPWLDKVNRAPQIEKVVEAGLWAFLSRGVIPETMIAEDWVRRAVKLRGATLWETPDTGGVFTLNEEFPAARDGDIALTGVGTPRVGAYVRQNGAFSPWGDPVLLGKFRNVVQEAARAGRVPDHVRVSVGLQPAAEEQARDEATAAKAKMQREDRATWQAVHDAAPLTLTVADAALRRAYVVVVQPRAFAGDQFEFWGVPRKARGHNYDVEGSGKWPWVLRAAPGSTTTVRAYPDALALREALVDNYAGDKHKIPASSTVLAATRQLAQRAAELR